MTKVTDQQCSFSYIAARAEKAASGDKTAIYEINRILEEGRFALEDMGYFYLDDRRRDLLRKLKAALTKETGGTGDGDFGVFFAG